MDRNTCNGRQNHTSLGVVASLLQEGGELGGTLVVPLLAPFDSWVIHLVDHNDELIDTLGLREDSVLTGLTTLLETSLVLALTGRDDEDTDIGLGGTANHGRYKVLVTRSIQNSVATLFSLEESTANLDGLSLGTLLASEIESPRQVPGLTALLLGLALELLHGTVVNHAGSVEDGASKGGLSSIDVANENQVNVLLFSPSISVIAPEKYPPEHYTLP